MKKFIVAAAVLAVLSVPGQSQAQVAFGPQLSWGSDSDLGVGARAVFGLPNLKTGLEGIISADYFFIDCGNVDCSYIEVNANGALNLSATSLNPYIGAGLNIARAAVESADNTEIGVNLLGGLKFPRSTITPFAEARLTVGGGEQFVITGGLLFGKR